MNHSGRVGKKTNRSQSSLPISRQQQRSTGIHGTQAVMVVVNQKSHLSQFGQQDLHPAFWNLMSCCCRSFKRPQLAANRVDTGLGQKWHIRFRKPGFLRCRSMKSRGRNARTRVRQSGSFSSVAGSAEYFAPAGPLPEGS